MHHGNQTGTLRRRFNTNSYTCSYASTTIPLWTANTAKMLHHPDHSQFVGSVDISWSSGTARKRRIQFGVLIKYSNTVLNLTGYPQKSISLRQESKYKALWDVARTDGQMRYLREGLGLVRAHTTVFQNSMGTMGCAKVIILKDVYRRQSISIWYDMLFYVSVKKWFWWMIFSICR